MLRPAMIDRALILRLGVTQLVCWGTTYYLIGAFGEAMIADLGWSRATVFGGLSLAVLIQGPLSAAIGRRIDRHGGRLVMAAGSVVSALALALLSQARELWVYYLAWAAMGIGMRLCLYDAAFATLANLGGLAAKRPISQITLLGGLASTAFWPIGHVLEQALGWRGGVLAFAAFALATLPLHLAIPKPRPQPPAEAKPAAAPENSPASAAEARERLAGFLFAFMMAVHGFVGSGMSAHMIGIFTGLGLAAGMAVSLSSLRGVAQSAARLLEVLFGARLHPLGLGVLAAAMAPIGVGSLLVLGGTEAGGAAMALFYGAGVGLMTIVRGAVPLVLFDPRHYGGRVGKLLSPALFLVAAAPLGYALLIERWGERGTLGLSLVLESLVFAAALALYFGFRRRSQ